MVTRVSILRHLFDPALIGVFTWAWIAGGIVALVAIVQGVFIQCTWLISPFGVQFTGCSTSTGTYVYYAYVIIALSGAGFAGFMGTLAGRTLKSGAKAGALGFLIPTLAESIVGLVRSIGSPVNMFPLSCITLPINIVTALGMGAFLGALGGWIGTEITRWRRRNDPPVLYALDITNDGLVIQGNKAVLRARAAYTPRAIGLRLYIDDKLVVETRQIDCSLELDTTRLDRGKHKLRVDVARTNDPGWSSPTSKETTLIVLPKEVLT